MNVIWDEVKAESNFQKHGISFFEAVTVLRDETAWTFMDTEDYDEDRFITVGHSTVNRVLLVVWCERQENDVRIISARKATRQERLDYEKRI